MVGASTTGRQSVRRRRLRWMAAKVRLARLLLLKLRARQRLQRAMVAWGWWKLAI